MKKLTTILITLTFTVSVHAQSSWGITGGKLFNNFNIGDGYSKSSSTFNSYSVGLFYKYDFGKRSQLNSTLTQDDKTTLVPDRHNRSKPAKQTVVLKYLTLDIGYNILIGKSQKLSAGGGIYYSRLQYSGINVVGEERINTANSREYETGLSINIQYKLTNKIDLLVKATTASTHNLIYEPFTMLPGTFCATPYIANTRRVVYGNSSLTVGINYTLIK